MDKFGCFFHFIILPRYLMLSRRVVNIYMRCGWLMG